MIIKMFKSLVNIIFSKILENEANKDIGLQLITLYMSPCLYIGFILEYLSLVWNAQ